MPNKILSAFFKCADDFLNRHLLINQIFKLIFYLLCALMNTLITMIFLNFYSESMLFVSQ